MKMPPQTAKCLLILKLEKALGSFVMSCSMEGTLVKGNIILIVGSKRITIQEM